jgi:hypothetical protein
MLVGLIEALTAGDCSLTVREIRDLRGVGPEKMGTGVGLFMSKTIIEKLWEGGSPRATLPMTLNSG